jgi:hypothetical protein
MRKPGVRERAKEQGPALLVALERLLSFPQNQDSTDPKLYDAIHAARVLVDRLRGPPKA